MTILYFSATGNSLYVAKTLGGQLVSIPQAIKQGIYHFSDDAIGIVFPVYGLGVPKYVEDFLDKVHLNGKYLFAVLSYGKFAGASPWHLLQIAKKNKMRFSYINTIKMVDNYLPFFKIENELETAPKKQIEIHLKTITADIQHKKKDIPKSNPVFKLVTKIMSQNPAYRNGIGLSNHYKIEDTCTACGICEKVCPVDNIKFDNGKPVIEKNCLYCTACTNNCPQNAIRLSNEKSKMRFRNEHTSLKEIVHANQ